MTANSAAIYRSDKRSVTVNFRTTPEGRERLRQRAAAAGLTIQAYIELTALGLEEPTTVSPGRPRKTPDHEEELPLTG